MRLTKEREAEIRDWPYLQTPPVMMWDASRELLAEIDALRAENHRLDDGSKGIAHESHLEHQIARLKSRIEKLRAALETIRLEPQAYAIRIITGDLYYLSLDALAEDEASKK